MFVSDLVLDRPEVTDVSHAVVAVGSRDKAKASKFIEEHCPKGACAQVKGIHKAPPQAYGSYDEVFAHPVSVVRVSSEGRGSGSWEGRRHG
jgi:predicted dehydrogenase